MHDDDGIGLLCACRRSVPQTAVALLCCGVLLVISFYMNIRNFIGDRVLYVRKLAYIRSRGYVR